MLSPHCWVQQPHPPKSAFFYSNCTVKSREGWVSVHRSSGRNQIKGLWEGSNPQDWNGFLLCQGAIKQLSKRCMCVWSIYQSARVTVAHMSTLKPGPPGILMRYGTPEPLASFNHTLWIKSLHRRCRKAVRWTHLMSNRQFSSGFLSISDDPCLSLL